VLGEREFDGFECPTRSLRVLDRPRGVGGAAPAASPVIDGSSTPVRPSERPLLLLPRAPSLSLPASLARRDADDGDGGGLEEDRTSPRFTSLSCAREVE
jgi:hypothetical protein